jgi:hypothetical protein
MKKKVSCLLQPALQRTIGMEVRDWA